MSHFGPPTDEMITLAKGLSPIVRACDDDGYDTEVRGNDPLRIFVSRRDREAWDAVSSLSNVIAVESPDGVTVTLPDYFESVEHVFETAIYPQGWYGS